MGIECFCLPGDQIPPSGTSLHNRTHFLDSPNFETKNFKLAFLTFGHEISPGWETRRKRETENCMGMAYKNMNGWVDGLMKWAGIVGLASSTFKAIKDMNWVLERDVRVLNCLTMRDGCTWSA